jgi:glyoxylase-like metal-dependent hydrolase (beta-lactamase superfamily II)
MIINTHAHGDHVSGNGDSPATVDVVTHLNTQENMKRVAIFGENGGGCCSVMLGTDFI